MSLLLIVTFLTFIYIEAYQDYKVGSVQLLLLIASLAITCIVMLAAEGWYSLIESLIYSIPVFLVFTVLSYKEKIGMADTIVLTQILILFGIDKFFLITIFSNVTALAYILVSKVAYRKEVKGVRYLPYVAVSSTIILVLAK